MMQHDMLQHLQLAKRPQIGFQRNIFLQITVYGKNRYRAVVPQRGGSIHQRHVGVIAAIILRAVQNWTKRRSAAILGGVHQRPENGLRPNAAAIAGHNGSNHVDQLRQAGHLHTVRIAEERNQHGADQQRILKVVNILQQRQSAIPLIPLPDFLILLTGMIPDIPLVKREVDLLLAVLLALHRIADGNDRLDEGVQIHITGQEIRRLIAGIAVVAVQAHIIDLIVAFVQHLVLPAAEGAHFVRRGAAGHQLDVGVYPLHHLARFAGGTAVFRGRLVAHLPGAVHFVAKAPELDAEGILRAVLDAQVAPIAAGGMIGVFHHIAGGVRSAGTQIDGVHHFRIGFFRPVHKFMQTDLVCFRGKPGQIQPFGALVARAYAVLPVEAGHKIAARIAHHRHSQPAHHLDYVAPESVLIRRRMSRLINAAVYGPAQMLNKGTINSGVDLSNGKISVHNQFGLFHVLSP